MTKPISKSELQQRIRNLLNSSNTNLSTATGKESFILRIQTLFDSYLESLIGQDDPDSLDTVPYYDDRVEAFHRNTLRAEIRNKLHE